MLTLRADGEAGGSGGSPPARLRAAPRRAPSAGEKRMSRSLLPRKRRKVCFLPPLHTVYLEQYFSDRRRCESSPEAYQRNADWEQPRW